MVSEQARLSPPDRLWGGLWGVGGRERQHLRWIEDDVLVGDSKGLELIPALLGDIAVVAHWERSDSCKEVSWAESTAQAFLA